MCNCCGQKKKRRDHVVLIFTRNVWNKKEFNFSFNQETNELIRHTKTQEFFWGFCKDFDEAAEALKFAGYEIIDYDGYAPKTAIMNKIAKEEGYSIFDVKAPDVAPEEMMGLPVPMKED